MISSSSLTQDIEFQLKRRSGPEILYKFRSATHDRCVESLRKGLITTPDAISLNDPFDSKPEALRRTMSWDDREKMLKQLRSRRFLCFSGPFTGGQYDILRWSHYGEGHKGFCLGIADPWLSSRARPVQYPPNYPDIADLKPSMDEYWDRVGFFKAPIWAYEDERRVIMDSDGSTYQLAPETLWSITFGCWSRPDQREQIMIAAFSHSPKCIVFQARVSPCGFGIRYEFINSDPEVKQARAIAARG